MLNTNLKRLRKIHQYTQEDLAEKLNISRQSVAKWESGESTPDIDSCIKLAKLYNVKLDDLVNHSEEKTGIIIPPKGKFFFGAVIVGEGGQIVIPKEARDIFNINTGDKLLILGDEERGLGIVHQRDLVNFIGHMGVTNNEE
ncbi:XRE family transcriptional regulator [Clostridioides difficile]|nr:helix-turn-helix transcriptional regulator [Clostridioides sp. ZZV14-6387]MDB3086380.1 XRE family transcriptional regulator [Clostridioides difficile]MDI0266215.1 helix-turn-helix domain-containing protein [Clostridioides difficile]MDI7816586.1 helix-turn-helix domain-containing protein [Clostridioides difficile]NJI80910.1 helix-turn-helix transcriptional regulator [Clostridioides difficile]